MKTVKETYFQIEARDNKEVVRTWHPLSEGDLIVGSNIHAHGFRHESEAGAHLNRMRAGANNQYEFRMTPVILTVEYPTLEEEEAPQTVRQLMVECLGRHDIPSEDATAILDAFIAYPVSPPQDFEELVSANTLTYLTYLYGFLVRFARQWVTENCPNASYRVTLESI